jgi:hypothetical protein
MKWAAGREWFGRDVWLQLAVATFDAIKEGRCAWFAPYGGRLGIDMEVRLEPVEVSDPEDAGR